MPVLHTHVHDFGGKERVVLKRTEYKGVYTPAFERVECFYCTVRMFYLTNNSLAGISLCRDQRLDSNIPDPIIHFDFVTYVESPEDEDDEDLEYYSMKYRRVRGDIM